MRYLTGSMTYLLRVRAGLAKLAGYPVRNMPVPPASPTYYPGALGWSDQLIAEPIETSVAGQGVMDMPSDVDPYLGETTDVDGVEVTVPTADQFKERNQLTAEEEQAVYNRENPPGPPDDF